MSVQSIESTTISWHAVSILQNVWKLSRRNALRSCFPHPQPALLANECNGICTRAPQPPSFQCPGQHPKLIVELVIRCTDMPNTMSKNGPLYKYIPHSHSARDPIQAVSWYRTGWIIFCLCAFFETHDLAAKLICWLYDMCLNSKQLLQWV